MKENYLVIGLIVASIIIIILLAIIFKLKRKNNPQAKVTELKKEILAAEEIYQQSNYQNEELRQTIIDLNERLIQAESRLFTKKPSQQGEGDQRQTIEQISDEDGNTSHIVSGGRAQATVQAQSQNQIQIGEQVIAQVRAQLEAEVQEQVKKLREEKNEAERIAAERYLQIEGLKNTAESATMWLEYEKRSTADKVCQEVRKKEEEMNFAARDSMGGDGRAAFIANRRRQEVKKECDRLLELNKELETKNEELRTKVQNLEASLKSKADAAILQTSSTAPKNNIQTTTDNPSSKLSSNIPSKDT